MKTRLIIFSSIALPFWLLSFISILAQPSAELLTPNTEICENAVIDLKIKFTGSQPFGAYIEYRNNETNALIRTEQLSNNEIFESDMVANVYTKQVMIDPASFSNARNIKISIVRVFDATIADWSFSNTTGTTNTSGVAIITSYQKPTPAAMPFAESCGYSIPLTATPGPFGDVYEWSTISGPSTGSFSPANNPSTLFSASPAGTYRLQFKVINGVCQESVQFDLNLKGSPSGNISTTSKICETGKPTLNVSLTGTGPWDVRYQSGANVWNVNGITNANHSWLHDFNVTGETTFIITRIEDLSTGCTAASTQMTGQAIVTDLKQTVNAGPNNLVACGNSFTMQALPGTGTGTWSGPAGTTYSAINSPTSGVTVTNANYGLQTFTWTLNNEGCISSDEVTVRFVELPTVTITNAPTVICEGSTALVNLSLSGSAPWNLSYLSGTTPASTSIATSPANMSLSPAVETNYQITRITDSYSCYTDYASMNFTINVDKMPTPNAGNDVEICGSSLLLSAANSPYPGEWDGIGNFNNPSDRGTSYSNNYGTYTLRWTEKNGECKAWDEVKVSLWEAPQSANAGQDQSLYLKFETLMAAEAPLVGIGTWSRINGNGNVTSINDPSSQITGLTLGTSTFRWTVTNGVCPAVFDEVTIEVQGLKHPTGFSPNGDGINDSFEIIGAPYIQNNELIVFNQAGEVVFKSKNYQNDWTGIGNDGKPVPDGYYYFIFSGNGISPIKDFLVIKRSNR